MKKIDQIIEQVKAEFEAVSIKFDSFHSVHEGYAVLLEEVDELWENVKLKASVKGRLFEIYREAKQIAAMAIRIIHDCCYGKMGLFDERRIQSKSN